MVELGFIAVVLLIGVLGWISYDLFSAVRQGSERALSFGDRISESFSLFLGGFAICSVILFLLAVFELFSLKAILLVSVLGVISYSLLRYRQKSVPRSITANRYFLFCVMLALVSLGYAKLTPPYETMIQGDDAAFYMAYPFQIVRSGGLSHHDKLVEEMSEEHKKVWFLNDQGNYERFPGGPKLQDLSTPLIKIGPPLFPLWLAFGVETLGSHGFLYLVSLFSGLSILTLFFLGRALHGNLLGIAVTVVFSLYFPQFYFSHLAMSEVLAQTLFLGGLWVLASGLKETPILMSGRQRLVGTLWGLLFLCRLDMLFYIPICGLLVAFTIPSFSKRLVDWWPLVALLSFFFFARHFIVPIGYDSIFGVGKSWVIGVFWKSLRDYLGLKNPILSRVVLSAGFLAAMLLLRFWLLKQLARLGSFWLAIIGISFTGLLFISLIGKYMKWDRFVEHAGWFSIYMSDWAFALLVTGILFFIITETASKDSGKHGFVLLFFLLIPASFFLFRPLMVVQQPWIMRRFVPMVFPLLFLLSFSGWYALSRKLFSHRVLLRSAVFAGIAFAITLSVTQKSAYLLKANLYEDLIAQVERLTETIPKNAVVVIPRSDATLNLHISLQYAMNRNCLILPDVKMEIPMIQAYLRDAQSRQRPIVFLSTTIPKSFYEVARSLNLLRQGTFPIFFRMVTRSSGNKFPNDVRIVALNYGIWKFVKERTLPVKRQIYYDDRNAAFIDFHREESGFRWTQGQSELRDFIFPTGGKSTYLNLTAASIKGFDATRLKMIVNDTIPATMIQHKGNEFVFHLKGGQLSDISSVTIRSDNFRPLQLKGQPDPRELGIRFVRLRFETE